MLLSKATLASLLIYICLLLFHSRRLPHPPLDPFTATTTTNSYLALCAAIKERPEDIKEWVDYHAALGFSKFYLMLTDVPAIDASLETLLQDHINKGTVELFPLPRVNPKTIPMLQVRLYDECLQSARGRHTWVAFWDGDEYLVPLDRKAIPFSAVRHSTSGAIPRFLKNYEEYGGLAVNWRTVGPSGHISRVETTTACRGNNTSGDGDGGKSQSVRVIENFKRCVPWDHADCTEIKTIVNVAKTLHPATDPHTFIYKNNSAFAVDAERRQVEGHLNKAVHEDWKGHRKVPKLALYHYVTKSEDEFREKSRKGSAMGNHKGVEFFDKVKAAATQVCEEALEVCVELGLCGGGSLDHS